MFVTLSRRRLRGFLFFFFNDTATTEIYTLSLHDALPISWRDSGLGGDDAPELDAERVGVALASGIGGVQTLLANYDARSEEHTSELQSRQYLVCRLLLEKKKHKSRDRMASELRTSVLSRP